MVYNTQFWVYNGHMKTKHEMINLSIRPEEHIMSTSIARTYATGYASIKETAPASNEFNLFVGKNGANGSASFTAKFDAQGQFAIKDLRNDSVNAYRPVLLGGDGKTEAAKIAVAMVDKIVKNFMVDKTVKAAKAPKIKKEKAVKTPKEKIAKEPKAKTVKPVKEKVAKEPKEKIEKVAVAKAAKAPKAVTVKKASVPKKSKVDVFVEKVMAMAAANREAK